MGVAGTVATLAAVDLGIYDPRRVHGHVLTRARIEEMLSWMSGLPTAERALIPGLEPARAPVIVAGATIVAAALGAVAGTRCACPSGTCSTVRRSTPTA